MSRKESPFQNVEPVRVFEQVAEQIQELIFNNIFEAGEKLPSEIELGKQFNVSRSSIREALRLIEAKGLIEIKHGQGSFVRDFRNKGQINKVGVISYWLHEREEMIGQVLQVRESIEGLTASLCAVQASEKELSNIRSIYEKQKQEVEKIKAIEEENYDVLAQLDAEFHLAISSASGNEVADKIVKQILPSFVESNKAVLYVSKRMSRMKNEHSHIIDALEARNSKRAEEVMREHLKRVRNEFLEIIHEP